MHMISALKAIQGLEDEGSCRVMDVREVDVMRPWAKALGKRALCAGLLAAAGPLAQRLPRSRENLVSFETYMSGLHSRAILREDDLKVQTFHDTIFDPRWNGLYTVDGRLLLETALTRHAEHRIVKAPTRIDVDMTSINFLPEAVYGGTIFDNHWGHFLMESLARLWPFEKNSNVRFLSELQWLFRRTTSPSERRQDGLPLVLSAIEGLGDRALLPNAPVRIGTIHVPERANVLGLCAAPAYGRLGAQLGDTLLHTGTRRECFSGRKVYLSRQGLSATKRRILGEAKLEEILVTRGYNILYPERLTLADQIALFSEAEMVVGCIGSAFHTQLLCPANPAATLYLCPDEPSLTYAIMDRLKATPAHYIHALYDTKLSGRYFTHQKVDISAVLTAQEGYYAD